MLFINVHCQSLFEGFGWQYTQQHRGSLQSQQFHGGQPRSVVANSVSNQPPLLFSSWNYISYPVNCCLHSEKRNNLKPLIQNTDENVNKLAAGMVVTYFIFICTSTHFMQYFLPDDAIVMFSLLKHPVSTSDIPSYTAFIFTRFRLFVFEDQAPTEIMYYISTLLRAAEL